VVGHRVGATDYELVLRYKTKRPRLHESLGRLGRTALPRSLLNHTLSTGTASVNSTVEPVTVKHELVTE
jgi:hypothetical protein